MMNNETRIQIGDLLPRIYKVKYTQKFIDDLYSLIYSEVLISGECLIEFSKVKKKNKFVVIKEINTTI